MEKGIYMIMKLKIVFLGKICFPENIKRVKFYTPIERGYEREIKKRLQWWDKLRSKNEK
jgi:ATPase related to the helicase subunit of the Holliday junction resolvase